MSFIAAAVIGGGAALLGGYMQSNASKSAANTAADSQNNATNAQLQMFNTQNAQQAPWREAGQTALQTIGQFMGPNGSGANQFTTKDLDSQLNPAFAWQKQQLEDTTKNAFNSGGGFIGGNAAQGLQSNVNNFLNTSYNDAFNRYQAQQSNIFNRLSTVAGYGSAANSQTGQLAGAMSPGIAGSIVGAGQARAAGQIGSANAIAGGLGGAGSWYGLSSMLGNNNSGGTGYDQTAYMNYLNTQG